MSDKTCLPIMITRSRYHYYYCRYLLLKTHKALFLLDLFLTSNYHCGIYKKNFVWVFIFLLVIDTDKCRLVVQS